MRKILIDTNIYCDMMRGDDEILKRLQKVESICVNTVIIGELLAGFKHGGRFKKNMSELDFFLDSPRVQVLGMTLATAEFYSDIYLSLRKAGTPIPTNDIWIAASAMENGLALFTLDKHFIAVKGLVLHKA